MMQKVLTFIMAGGKGERLWPLTKDRTKPAVPFGGIYRIIDFSLSNCINSGMRKIYILTQYKSASLQRHIRLGWNILASELSEYIEILPAQQRVGETQSRKWHSNCPKKTVKASFRDVRIASRIPLGQKLISLVQDQRESV